MQQNVNIYDILQNHMIQLKHFVIILREKWSKYATFFWLR